MKDPAEEFKRTFAWARLKIALARYAGLGRNLNDGDPRQLPMADVDYVVLIAIAAAGGDNIPYLNQEQLTQLLHEKAPSTVSAALTKLRENDCCRELSLATRRSLGLPRDRRSNYYRVTTKGIEALGNYESIRFGLPPVVADELRRSPDYSRVLEIINESISKILRDEFSDVVGAKPSRV